MSEHPEAGTGTDTRPENEANIFLPAKLIFRGDGNATRNFGKRKFVLETEYSATGVVLDMHRQIAEQRRPNGTNQLGTAAGPASWVSLASRICNFNILNFKRKI